MMSSRYVKIRYKVSCPSMGEIKESLFSFDTYGVGVRIGDGNSEPPIRSGHLQDS